MTVENKKKAIKLRFSSFLMVIAAVVLILMIVYTNIAEPFENMGIKKSQLIILVALLLVIIGIWRYIMDYHYFYFSDQGPNLSIRYSSLRPFTSSKNAIEIKKERFAGYNIVKYLFGIKPYLILTVKNNFDKRVNYPPVSLSGLNKKQRNQLKEVLKKY